jgi:hypothetical protein
MTKDGIAPLEDECAWLRCCSAFVWTAAVGCSFWWTAVAAWEAETQSRKRAVQSTALAIGSAARPERSNVIDLAAWRARRCLRTGRDEMSVRDGAR